MSENFNCIHLDVSVNDSELDRLRKTGKNKEEIKKKQLKTLCIRCPI